MMPFLMSFCSKSAVKPEDTTSITENSTKNYNIIVLLDLSDRIKVDNQAERDKKIITSLLDSFEGRQDKFGYTLNDSFIISIAQYENSNIKLSTATKDLRIEMAGLDKPDFDEKKDAFLKNIDTLYQQAGNNSESSSDIYRFFQYSLSNVLKPSKDFNNKLIILTDGYMSFQGKRSKGTFIAEGDLEVLRNSGSDWEHIFHKNNMGLDASQINVDTRNLQIMLLEMNPKNSSVNELNFLKTFWKNWFEAMGVYDPTFIQCENPIENIDTPIIKFLEKKTLQDSMKERINLKGKSYESHLLEGKEIVSNHKGKYFIIDIASNKSSTAERKTIYFDKGDYTIKDFEKYGEGIKEFNESVRKQLENSEFKDEYEIFVKGSADQGGAEYKRDFEKNYKYNEICFLPRFNNASFLFSNVEKCETITPPITNKMLPNLRAKFLKEKFDAFYSAKYKPSKILDGSVIFRVSEFERNGTFILYLPDSFFKE
jgi:hypothetical protein